ncbi:MAG: prolyl oligopeptidase family serine peptidase [Bacteroidota bacterium]
MKFSSIPLLLLLLIACQTKENDSMASEAIKKTDNPVLKVIYPETETVDQEDDYFGTKIADPYRWLEDDRSSETEAWVKEQNKVTSGYLEQITYREAIEDRYEELFDYPKLSSPFKAGDYYFFYKKEGLQNQYVIYRQKGLEGEAEVFIDPNTMNEEGTSSIALIGFSEDNKYVTYSRSDAGSDWSNLYVMNVETKEQLSDRLEWVKFSGASWYQDGFFYSRYPKPEGSALSTNNQLHSVYYHKLGTDQNEDELIYRDEKNPNYYHFTTISEDKEYLILYVQPGTDGFATYYKKLDTDNDFRLLFEGFSNKSSIVHHLGEGKMLVRTDIDAPKYRLIEVDVNNPDQNNWKDIIPESEDLLQSVSTGGGQLFANYLKDATDRYYRLNYDGSNKQEINLPGLGSAGGFGGKEEDQTLFYSFTSFTNPPTIFKYDVASGKSEAFYQTEMKFNPEDYVEKQIFYTSKDGTKIPMFIVHKKGLELDGDNPTYLYAYGGFNVSLSPSFSSSNLILLENGGVYAMANLRGGGEYGEEWHKAGMLLNKQNVFDDFIAAGEYLIAEKYTNKEKLAVAGGSNGGLLVGAVMTQRPDLFAVAFPAVGVMDMLRYHKFTVGKGWIPEYGSSEASEEDFRNLRAYSPLHNLKENVAYPATMVTTADHDDRVVPAHSFKFAAQLQKSHRGENPVLIRIETDAGHGAGKPTAKIIEEQADKWAFFFYNTNSPVKYIEG